MRRWSIPSVAVGIAVAGCTWAWRRVRRTRGGAGVDGETLAAVEQYGVERMLCELASALRGRRASEPWS